MTPSNLKYRYILLSGPVEIAHPRSADFRRSGLLTYDLIIRTGLLRAILATYPSLSPIATSNYPLL
jgi:hypothetical protein